MAGSKASDWRRFAAFAAVFAVGVVAGVVLGGWGVRDVQPRSLLGVDRGHDPASLEELAGLVGSAVVQHAPGLLPVVMTTQRSVVVRYPIPGTTRVHLVVVPRRDIYDPTTLAHGDEAYLIDAFATMAELARREHLSRFKIIANGPREQSVRYLHFHLVSIDNPRGSVGTARDSIRYDVP